MAGDEGTGVEHGFPAQVHDPSGGRGDPVVVGELMGDPCNRMHYPGNDPENGPAEPCRLVVGHAGSHRGRSQGMVLGECSEAKLDSYPPIPSRVECPDCNGECGDEGPVTCSWRCDWCGGCLDLSSECGTCEGAGEVVLEAEQCHASANGEHCEHCGEDDAQGDALICCFCGYDCDAAEAAAIAAQAAVVDA